jgi:hypothetical protein
VNHSDDPSERSPASASSKLTFDKWTGYATLQIHSSIRICVSQMNKQVDMYAVT